jgi:diguanylate cyclase (GGDEF)-like protein
MSAHAGSGSAARRIGLGIVGLVSTLASFGAMAATPVEHAAGRPMRFDQGNLDDGLSQSNVFTILQDARGLMWFGTESGLNRYDGYDFEVFKRQRGNPDSLVSDYIYDMAEDADGSLWLASNGGGLARMNRDSRTFTTYRHDPDDSKSVSSNVIRKLLIDADGTIWLGTLGAGVDRFDPGQGVTTHYRFGDAEDPSQDINEVFALYRDASAALWIGTNNGLVRLDTSTGKFEHYAHSSEDPRSISGQQVRTILEDSHGTLWVGTYADGLNRFDPKTGSFDRYRHDPANPASLSGDRVTTVFEDSDGRIWVGTYAGLNLLDRKTGTFARYSHDSQDASSLGDDIVTAIFEDRGGILWVGTRNQGLSKWNPRSWALGLENARELTKAGDVQPNVTSFVEDPSGTLWIGTFGDGLHAVDRAKNLTTTYRHDPANPNSLSDDRVMSLARDRDGNIWAGTMTGGLNRLNPETGQTTVFMHERDDPGSLSANGVMAVFEDSDGFIWAGTYGGGASRFDAAAEKFTNFLPSADQAGSISSNRVRAFAEDRSGKLWIGTDSGGLNLFDPATESFLNFRHDPFDAATLADDTIYAINVDAGGTVWIGTQGGGLDRVVGSATDPETITFANVSQADGLSNDVVYGLQVDDSGTVWLSTNYGISRYNPVSGAIRNMHRKDGLQSEEFNSGAHYRSASGELFFGGPNGFNAFQPGEITGNQSIPPIILTGLFNGNDRVTADRPVDASEGIDISYKDDVVSFEFAALDYTASEQNQYRYKLEGFDKEWIELGHRRRATYTDLNDGQYLLRVQAANSDGVWNEAGFAIPVRVSPAPWDTWWAYLGYAAMTVQLGVFLWLWHRRRVRREEEYSSRLENEVRERTGRLLESNRKLKELNQSLQESSLSDPLTGLRNRRFVFEEVSRDLDVVRRKLNDQDQGHNPKDTSDLVFMMIDLDNFKPINDTYGHAAGDQMLLDVRDVLLGTCRKSDFVVRWGGDEFVVIAKQAKPGESEALAERIRSKIAERNFMLADGQIVRTTCSIGFAAFPLFRGQAEDADLDQVLTLADSLMYEAKRHRNAWAGILSPSDASTSFAFDHEAIEPSSILYRAKRAGRLVAHADGFAGHGKPNGVSAAG